AWRQGDQGARAGRGGRGGAGRAGRRRAGGGRGGRGGGRGRVPATPTNTPGGYRWSALGSAAGYVREGQPGGPRSLAVNSGGRCDHDGGPERTAGRTGRGPWPLLSAPVARSRSASVLPHRSALSGPRSASGPLCWPVRSGGPVR